MRNGQNCSAFRGAAECREHKLFRVGIKVCGYFIKKQDGRLRRDCTGDGEKLPLAL